MGRVFAAGCLASSLRSVACMLIGVRNRDEPTLSPRHPQLISGAEMGWRIIERADPYLNLVSAVDDRKDGRPTPGTEMAIVGRKLPASSLTSDRHLARLPHSEEVAERSGLLPADLAVAKADPHRSPIDLKLHLTAVAATRSLQHGNSTVEDAHLPHLAGSDGKPGPRGARHHPPNSKAGVAGLKPVGRSFPSWDLRKVTGADCRALVRLEGE
jgi:hypothetical protein